MFLEKGTFYITIIKIMSKQYWRSEKKQRKCHRHHYILGGALRELLIVYQKYAFVT